jgi:hypothetical protein
MQNVIDTEFRQRRGEVWREEQVGRHLRCQGIRNDGGSETTERRKTYKIKTRSNVPVNMVTAPTALREFDGPKL